MQTNNIMQQIANAKPEDLDLSNVYTEKQQEAMMNYLSRSFKVMILYGAVRVGKTIINNDLFLIDLMRVRKMADKDKVKVPLYVLAGYSNNTIVDNVLNPLQNRYGFNIKFDKNGSFTLFGVKVLIKYTNNERAVGAMRGFTAYGAYVNEASLAVESVFNELNNRVSIDGAHILVDTNPDAPTHWLKKNWIDKEDDPDLQLITEHFRLDDNKRFLGDKYVSQLKASYGSGASYDRAILGLWTAAEGAVYADWYDDENYINREDLPSIKRYYAGVDWGYKHYGSLVIIGEDYDGNLYLVDEHSKKLKNIDYWIGVAHEFQDKYGQDLLFIADSARTEHIDAFNNNNIQTILANKKVDAGIELMASLIKLRNFKVVRDVLENKDSNGNSISIFEDNIHGYVWDDKKGVVVKEHDDCLDPIRYVTMYIYSHRGSIDVAELAEYI